MGEWRAWVNVNEIIMGAQDEDTEDPKVVQKVAQNVADRLSARLPQNLFDTTEAGEIVSEFRRVQNDAFASAEDLDGVIEQMQQWANYYRVWLGI